MSAHILLNLLNKLRKSEKIEACQAFYGFFATCLINSIIQEHKNVRFYLSHDVKITYKLHFWVNTSRFCHLLGSIKMDVIT